MPHDVIIVGSGIAGAYLASTLSESGLKVLVLEREPNECTSFCGEMTGLATLKRLGLSKEYIINTYKSSKLVNLDNNFEIEVPSRKAQLILIDAQRAKSKLIDEAISDGAEVKFKSIVTGVVKEKGKVTGVKVGNKTIKGNVVIGSDGSSSVVAKSAGFNLKPYKALPSFRFKYKNANVKSDEALFLIKKELGLGYLWLYPQSRTKVNVGVGAIGNPNMTKIFNSYVKSVKGLKGAKVYARGGDTIPYSGVLPEIARPGAALVGDSAGQVDPLLGGGVTTSTSAAEILAPYVVKAMDNPNSLLEYDIRYRRTKDYKMITRGANMLSVLERMHKKGDLFSLLEEVQSTFSDKTLKKASKGELTKLDYILYALRHPVLSYRVLKAVKA